MGRFVLQRIGEEVAGQDGRGVGDLQHRGDAGPAAARAVLRGHAQLVAVLWWHGVLKINGNRACDSKRGGDGEERGGVGGQSEVKNLNVNLVPQPMSPARKINQINRVERISSPS